MKRCEYRFGTLGVVLELADSVNSPENLEKFRATEPLDEQVVLFQIEYADDIQESEAAAKAVKTGDWEVQREHVTVFNTKEGECRLIRFAGTAQPYAVNRRIGERRHHVLVDRAVAELLVYDAVFMAMLGLERYLMEKGMLLLHSAYIRYGEAAILFSAPSETGKSTQARLWEQYRSAETINGDRSLLVPGERRWQAYGWPVCGSSGVCRNETWPVGVIVMLKQARENTIRRLALPEAFRSLMSQITINGWDRRFQTEAMDQIEGLVKSVPVYELACDMSENAVVCLESALLELQEEKG